MTCNLMWVSGEGFGWKNRSQRAATGGRGSFPRSDKPWGREAPALSA